MPARLRVEHRAAHSTNGAEHDHHSTGVEIRRGFRAVIHRRAGSGVGGNPTTKQRGCRSRVGLPAGTTSRSADPVLPGRPDARRHSVGNGHDGHPVPPDEVPREGKTDGASPAETGRWAKARAVTSPHFSDFFKKTQKKRDQYPESCTSM